MLPRTVLDLSTFPAGAAAAADTIYWYKSKYTWSMSLNSTIRESDYPVPGFSTVLHASLQWKVKYYWWTNYYEGMKETMKLSQNQFQKEQKVNNTCISAGNLRLVFVGVRLGSGCANSSSSYVAWIWNILMMTSASASDNTFKGCTKHNRS